MVFQTAQEKDTAAVTRLYEEGSARLRARGIDQWQHGDPGAATAAADIAAGVCRIAYDADGAGAATFTLVPEPEPSYAEIDGEWLTNGGYAALHRVAASSSCRGAGAEIVRAAAAEARKRGFVSLRGDTHPDNLPMQRLLERSGFTRCGRIRLASGPDRGAPRIAYERLLTPRLYDISQELLGSVVFPGDPAPVREQISSIARGDAVNVSHLRLCAHNGTHMDAPLHFVADAASIADMPLDQFVGEADVVSCAEKVFGAREAERLIPPDCTRLLLRGVIPDLSGAEAIVRRGVRLVGVEPQSVGDPAAPAPVHRCLLGAGVAALEGIRLDGVPDGRYFLSAAPLKIAGCDGAPVRAFLLG